MNDSNTHQEEPVNFTTADIDELIDDLKQDDGITHQSAIQYCYHQLFYSGPSSLHRRLATQLWDAGDFAELKRRIQICRQILTLPNLPTGDIVLPGRQPPRGWKLNPNRSDSADQSESQAKTNAAAMDAVWTELKSFGQTPDKNLDEAMMSQIFRSTVDELLVEKGVSDVPSFWKDVEQRVQEVISF